MEDINDLRTELRGYLVEAKPLDHEPTLEDPKGVAEYAAKRVGFYGYGNGQLLAQASRVENAQQCAKILVECLAALPRPAESNGKPEPQESDLLTLEEAAAYLRMTESGLRKLKDDKKIRYVQSRKGGRIKFLLEDLEEHLEANTNGPDDLECAPARAYHHPIQSGHGFI